MVVHANRVATDSDGCIGILNRTHAHKAVAVTEERDRVRRETMWKSFNAGASMIEIGLQWRVPAEEVEQILRDERERLRVERLEKRDK